LQFNEDPIKLACYLFFSFSSRLFTASAPHYIESAVQEGKVISLKQDTKLKYQAAMSFKRLEAWGETEFPLVLAHYHTQVYFMLIY